VPPYFAQQVGALQRDSARQQAQILALSTDLADLRRIVCVLVARLEKVQVRPDPKNNSHNYVVASDGPMRSEAQVCPGGGR